ncbi:MAG TPA: ferritin-like domain-containing protein [Stellaceae bacterium]|nr:ferritin-like domain-containing protein [Stellaceae bacterium]
MTDDASKDMHIDAALRRDLIRSGLAGLGLVMGSLLSGCTSAIGAHEAASAGNDRAMLANAHALEDEAVAAYEAALQSGLLSAEERDLALRFQSDHRKHAAAIAASAAEGAASAAAGTPAARRAEAVSLTSREDALRFLLDIEKGLALAYLGWVPAYFDRDLAKGAAGILGVETMHWALLRRALGEEPVPAAILG